MRGSKETAMPRPKQAPPEPDEFVFKEPGEDPAYDAWFREQVQIGIDQADRGETIPHEQVQAEWEAVRAKLMKRIAEGE
jgi:hypothetical protein